MMYWDVARRWGVAHIFSLHLIMNFQNSISHISHQKVFFTKETKHDARAQFSYLEFTRTGSTVVPYFDTRGENRSVIHT